MNAPDGPFRDDLFLPHVSVDCVIFGFHGGELKVLLMRWKHPDGAWSLPGGPVRRSESVDEAAHSVLRARTGLERIFLQQFHAFGGTRRGEGVLRTAFAGLGLPVPDDFWLADRNVSIGYYALVDFATVTPAPDLFATECRWWDVRERPALLFDHGEMVETALCTLQRQLSHQPIGLNLLPEKFTMSELQKLYEAVLGRTLDRRNFQKKILDLGIVVRLDERRTGGAHRSPYLYRFDLKHYEQALRDGLSFGF